MSKLDLAAIRRPTIVEVWAPSCVECRAINPDLQSVARTYSEDVELVMVNAAEDIETARNLKVMGTPTLIGARGGKELFRFTGRRTRSELEGLFSAVAAGDAAHLGDGRNLTLRLGVAGVLASLGLSSGPTWALVIIGGGVAVLTAVGWAMRNW